MTKHHVLIGGGPAATNAMETIRRFAADDRITLISDEPAHSRMALPYWLCGKIPAAQTHTADAEYFSRLRVDTRVNQRVTQIDSTRQSVTLEDGSTIDYDDLLLATGSRPLPLPIPGSDRPGVQPMWRLDDAARALARIESLAEPRVALVGAGFIGLIIGNALHQRRAKLTVVERDGQILPRMLPASAAQLAQSWLTDQGVDVHTGTAVVRILADDADPARHQLELATGEKLGPFDLVVIAIGVKPNIELAQQSGLSTDHGILVDEHLQTSVPNIYAAGDVAQGPVLFSSTREVHAIQPTAVDHGRVAGANMAGRKIVYPGSLSMNVLDVCGLQCASFGQWTSSNAERTVVSNPATRVHRELVWADDHLMGAVFAGRPADMGLLTDIGMVKGLIQTRMPMGSWKAYLQQNPFDVRRAYIATGVAQRLTQFELLGTPAQPRQYRVADAHESRHPSPHHPVYVDAARPTHGS